VTAQALPTVLPPSESAGTGSTVSVSSGLALAEKKFRYFNFKLFLDYSPIAKAARHF